MGVTVRATGFANIIKDFEKLAGDDANPEEAWREVGNYLSKAVEINFQTQGAYMGAPWKPLNARYALSKARKGLGNTMLVVTGAMKRRFVGRPMDIERAVGRTGLFGSSDRIAVFQHMGTHSHKTGKRIIPPRKIIRITPSMKEDMAQIMIDTITRGNRLFRR